MDKTITISNKISIPDPTPELLNWVKNNLVLQNPEYTKKIRMNLWIGNTPKTLDLYETVGHNLILPYGVLPQIQEFVKGYKINDITKKVLTDGDRSVLYIGDIPLYDYQKRAVDVMGGKRCGILTAPAGSGKTQMGIALAKKHGRRVLWLTHTKDLLTQSKSRAEQYLDTKLMGTITEGKIDIGVGMTFATVQTMANINLPEYQYYWDVIIVDEAHRAAGTPTALTQFAKVLSSLSSHYKYGLTATIHRSDGLIKGTHALLGEVIHRVTDAEVGDKIMRVGIQPVETFVKIDRDSLNTDGTLNYARFITSLTENKDRNDLIVSYLMTNDERPSLILSARVSHLETIYSSLPTQLKQVSAVITGTTKKEIREKVLNDMRSGKLTFLFATYSLAKEGLDIPRLENLYLTTPQKDYAVITQSIGRIARQHEGKLDPICYDFVDDIDYAVKAYRKRKTSYNKRGCYYL